MAEEDMIDSLLEAYAKKQAQKIIITPRDKVPKFIPYSNGAYDKDIRTGPLLEKLSGFDYEYSAFLLAEKGDPLFIVRDLILEKDQEIRRGGVRVNGETIGKINYALRTEARWAKRNLYAIGWTHGHGGVRYLGPSPEDKDNFGVVLNSHGLNTEQRIYAPLDLIETKVRKSCKPGKIKFWGKALEDCLIEHNLSNDKLIKRILKKNKIDACDKEVISRATEILYSLLEASDTTYHQPHIFGFAYFVITSNHKDVKPYGAIGIIEEKVHTPNSKKISLIEDVSIKTRDVPNDIEVSEKELKKEIRENIPFHRKFFTGYTGRFIRRIRAKNRKRNKGRIMVPDSDDTNDIISIIQGKARPQASGEMLPSNCGEIYPAGERIYQIRGGVCVPLEDASTTSLSPNSQISTAKTTRATNQYEDCLFLSHKALEELLEVIEGLEKNGADLTRTRVVLDMIDKLRSTPYERGRLQVMSKYLFKLNELKPNSIITAECESAPDCAKKNKPQTKTQVKKDFKVGDKIRMNKTANDNYAKSKEGSEGVITNIGEINNYDVSFTKVTGDYHRPLPVTWKVKGIHMDKCLDMLIEKNPHPNQK